jgi:proteasome lid subunit RPN8/RPN11
MPRLRDRLSAVVGLKIPRRCMEHMTELVCASHPHEACGLLGGQCVGRWARIDLVHPVPNLSAFPDSFTIGPEDEERFSAGLRGGRRLIGLYHSHRHAPRPSAADLESMALRPLIWLIAGREPGGTAPCLLWSAFRIRDGRLGEVEVQIE